MTLRHLEIFSAVCAQESFTRAAEQLNMAQPAVSLAIRELEVFYNVRLFERMNRRVYLTEAGRTLRQYADTVLSQFQESVEVLRERVSWRIWQRRCLRSRSGPVFTTPGRQSG